MLKRKDRLPGQVLRMRRCQDATGGGFMPQGSSQSQLVSITTIVTNINIIIIITNIFVFIITITLSFRLLDTFSYVFAFAKFWHFCFICFALFCFCLILLIITMWRGRWSKSGQIQDAVSFHDWLVTQREAGDSVEKWNCRFCEVRHNSHLDFVNSFDIFGFWNCDW